MNVARFALSDCDSVATDLGMLNQQQITTTQPSAEADLYVRRQQYAIRASARTSRHLRGYRKQLPHLVQTPSAHRREGVLHPADIAVAAGGKPLCLGRADKREDHPTMSVDGDRPQLRQRLGQVGVDLFSGDRLHIPRQPLGQDVELADVSMRDTVGQTVPSGKIPDAGHGEYPFRATLAHVLGGCARSSGGYGIADPRWGTVRLVAILTLAAGIFAGILWLIWVGVVAGQIAQVRSWGATDGPRSLSRRFT